MKNEMIAGICTIIAAIIGSIILIAPGMMNHSLFNSSDAVPENSAEIDTPEQPSIEIISPANGTSVNKSQTVKGTARKIPKGFQMWLVLYAHHPTYRYYPQRPFNTDPNGNWYLPNVTFGTENNVGYRFSIMIVLADKSAQKEFMEYFNNSKGKWGGTSFLPMGAKEYANVTVTRT